MKKKFLFFMFAICLILPCAFMLTACGADPPHEHSFGAWQTVQSATCSDDGVSERFCSCGERETQPIPSSGEHNYGSWQTESPANCNVEGLEARYCQDCGNRDERPIATNGEHSMLYSAGWASTCTTQGQKEHWSCYICEKEFSDENGNNEITDLSLPLASHDTIHNASQEASCTGYGTIEYWQCADCSKIFSDEACTQEITNFIIPALPHTKEYHARVEATCEDNGNIEYWYCTDCERYFTDIDCTQETINVVIPSLPHSSIIHHDYVANNCVTKGNIEYWECGVCHIYFEDSRCEYMISDKTSVDTGYGPHNRYYNTPVHATCTETGIIEYWSCDWCDKYFGDFECEDEITDKNVVEPLIPHDSNHVSETNSDCYSYQGHIEYWYCGTCSKMFADEDCTQETTDADVTKPYAPHTLTHYPYKAPECSSFGNKEYWYCSVCYRYFSDKDGKTSITYDDWYLQATHTYTHVPTVDSTCTDKGVAEHYICTGTCQTSTYTAYFDMSKNPISDLSTLEIAMKSHTFENSKCIVCGYDETATIGLEYQLNEDEQSYSVSGIGTASAETNIVVSSTYKNKPVTGILYSAFAYNKTIKKLWLPDTMTFAGIMFDALGGLVLDEFSIPNTDCYATALGKKTIVRGLNSNGGFTMTSYNPDCMVEDLVLPEGLLEITDVPTCIKRVTIPASVVSIAGGAFLGCSLLEEIDIPSTQTKIYERTFQQCTSLTSVELPEGIIEIEESAFNGCTSLETINLPTTLSKIGRFAFADCEVLTSLTITSNITQIDNYAYAYCDGLESVTFNLSDHFDLEIEGEVFADCTNIENVYVNNFVSWCKVKFGGVNANPTSIARSLTVNGTKLGTTIEIPAEVTQLLDYTFAGLTETTTIIIPATTTIAGYGTFWDVGENVESVTMPYYNGVGVRQILGDAPKLKTLTINAGTVLDAGNQSNATNLETLTIPASMQKFTYINFAQHNPNLTTINIASIESWINTVVTLGVNGGMGDVVIKYNSNPVTTITLASDIKLPSNSGIKYLALSTATVPVQVVSQLPSSVQYLTINGGENLYVGNRSNLKELTINDGLKYIGSIGNCAKLETIYLPSTLEGIGSLDTYNYLLDSLEYNVYNNGKYLGTKTNPYLVLFDMVDDSIEGFRIHNNCKFIEGNKFSYYAYATTIIEDDCSVSCIEYEDGRKWVVGSSAYEGAQIVLPEGIVGIANNVFSKKEFTLIGLPESLKYIGEYAFTQSKLISIAIPDSVTFIGEGAFRSCSELTDVKLPATLERICDYTFEECVKLKNIYLDLADIPNSTKLPTSLKYIGDRAFYNCGVLTSYSLTLPEGLLEIGESAFYGCNMLTVVSIPNSVVSIGSLAFNDCINLIKVTLSDNLSYLGSSAFDGTKITTLALNEGIVDTDEIFWHCDELVSVVLPKSITIVEEEGFYGSEKFTTIYYLGTSEDWEKVNYYGSEEFKQATTIYFYSDSQPQESGNYWHYIGGVVTKW